MKEKYSECDKFRKIMFNIVRREVSSLRLTSFSKEGLENPLMWGHYADKMRGICVRYELEDGFHGIEKVRYSTNGKVPHITPKRVLEKKQEAML